MIDGRVLCVPWACLMPSHSLQLLCLRETKVINIIYHPLTSPSITNRGNDKQEFMKHWYPPGLNHIAQCSALPNKKGGGIPLNQSDSPGFTYVLVCVRESP